MNGEAVSEPGCWECRRGDGVNGCQHLVPCCHPGVRVKNMWRIKAAGHDSDRQHRRLRLVPSPPVRQLCFTQNRRRLRHRLATRCIRARTWSCQRRFYLCLLPQPPPRSRGSRKRWSCAGSGSCNSYGAHCRRWRLRTTLTARIASWQATLRPEAERALPGRSNQHHVHQRSTSRTRALRRRRRRSASGER